MSDPAPRRVDLSDVPTGVLDMSELLPDGLLVVDGSAMVRFANRRAGEILGLDQRTLVGRPVREALPLRDGDGRSWWDLTDPWNGLHTRKGHREKLLLTAADVQVLLTANYIRPARGKPVQRVIMALRDALARQRAEQDHAALISTVAHELRSPLTSVKGFSSTLLRRWDRFTDDQKRLMIETIEADADRVTRLITELLDVSRIDAGRLTLRTQPVDIPAVIERHIGRFEAGGTPRDRFLVDVGTRLPEVWADPDRLDQILSNLLENAVRHGSGTVTLTVMAEPGGAGPRDPAGHGPAVLVSVADEGEGIPEQNYSLVFSRFWHGTERGTTGLGLYVVRGLVEAHGGSITVGRGRAGGAEFRFTLPSGPPEHLR